MDAGDMAMLAPTAAYQQKYFHKRFSKGFSHHQYIVPLSIDCDGLKIFCELLMYVRLCEITSN